MFAAALLTIAEIWKQPKPLPTSEKMKKIRCMEHYSNIKKKEILPIVTTWMKLKDIMLSKTSQTEKDRYCLALICGILKSKTGRNGGQRWGRNGKVLVKGDN